MSQNKKFNDKIKKAEKTAFTATLFLVFAAILLLFVIYDPTFSVFRNSQKEQLFTSVYEDEDRIENGIHVRTGLIDAEGLMTVVNNCTNCHSSKLVIQNRMDTERWNTTIKWMQETQNLWDLGKNQQVIVNYLVTNYPQIEKGRRMNLTNIDWYEL